MGCCASCDEGKPCASATPAQITRPAPWLAVVGALAIESGYVNGAGVDVEQSRRARGQQTSALFTDLTPESPHVPGARAARADLDPMHDFRERVNIVTATQIQTAAANDSGVPALPGRFPTAGWDGEQSAASPVADRGGM